ncbi:MAG: hypothetical protein M8349_02035 [ANME-2 cluster archaeon]|nr:hypothetical protein [ANME-2 cluster archaeon]MDF1558146.1 hypothetical protein [ANME-2 cluster archaeon]
MSSTIEDSVTAHLGMIESVYEVKIRNKSEVSRWIGDRTDEEKTALTMTMALNTWVMMNIGGVSVDIPNGVLDLIHYNLIHDNR